MRRTIKNIAATAAFICTIAVAANAQTQLQSKFEDRLNAALKKVQTACDGDLRKYCGEVTLGEGRLLLCLEAHEDKIDSKCDYSLFEASRNLDRALDSIAETADACGRDIEAYCAQAPEGGGHIVECLFRKRQNLAPTCRSQLRKLFQSEK